jgi:NAD-dependent dihydropyrimidine dehydrogenase PreA subunit
MNDHKGRTPDVPSFDRCSRAGCEEVCPWDMVSIIVDGRVCCSPDCATVVLEELPEAPSIVTLHEPQFHVDRDALGIPHDATEIWRDVENKDDAEAAIRQIAELYPGRFRAAR